VKAVDTNVLLRVFLRDEPGQTAKAESFLERVESRGARVFVPFLVLVEVMWVLRARFRLARARILQVVEQVLRTPLFEVEQAAVWEDFLRRAPQDEADLEDILISVAARHHGCEGVVSFDRGGVRAGLFEALD
jgi:predicted nucleic-acid-binding protein